MAEILKFPAQGAKLGYTRVKQRARTAADHPHQLSLFPPPSARILSFPAGGSPFEQALMLDERDDPKAPELYARAIEQGDCVADCYCNLGIIESQKGNSTRAFDCFTSALKEDPRHCEAHYNLANLYFDLNDFRLAQVHYQMAAGISPTFANVYFNLALVQVINNEPAAAVDTLHKYQQLVPAEEGTIAEKLVQELKQSLAAVKNSRVGNRS